MLLGQDNVAPSLAWLLFVETPWSFLRAGVQQDRAIVLEESWERAWGVAGRPPHLFAQREQALADPGGPEVPLLLLNGTSVESGCRFVATVLEVNQRRRDEPAARCLAPLGLVADEGGILGGTNDLVDFLCDNQDLRLSTAAFLSARFPLISPTGNLYQCTADPARRPQGTYIVDGGYLEGSGTSTILALWDALAPLVEAHNRDPAAPAAIVPVLLQIDNGYSEPSAPGATEPPPQFVAPATTLGAARSGNEAVARQNAQLAFTRPFPTDDRGDDALVRYAYFPLRAHPGPRATLGWTLSPVAFDDLVDQYGLLNPCADTASPAAVVDAWFAPLAAAAASLRPGASCLAR